LCSHRIHNELLQTTGLYLVIVLFFSVEGQFANVYSAARRESLFKDPRRLSVPSFPSPEPGPDSGGLPRGLNPAYAGISSVYFIQPTLDLSKLELKTLDIDELIDFQEKWEEKTSLSKEARSIIECLSTTIRDRLEFKAKELHMKGMFGLIGPDNQPNVSNDEIFDIISEIIRPTSKMGMAAKFERVKFPFYDTEMFVSRNGRLEHFEEIRHLICKHASRWAKRIKILTHNSQGMDLLPPIYSRKEESRGLVQQFIKSIPGDLGKAILREMAISELESLGSFTQFRELLEHALNGLQRLQYQITERQDVFGIGRKDPINKDRTNQSNTSSTFQARQKTYDQYKKSFTNRFGGTNQNKHNYNTRGFSRLNAMGDDDKDEEPEQDEAYYGEQEDSYAEQTPSIRDEDDEYKEIATEGYEEEKESYEDLALLQGQAMNTQSMPCNNMILYGRCRALEVKNRCAYSHNPRDLQAGKLKLAQRLMTETSTTSQAVHTSSATPATTTTTTTTGTPTIMKRPVGAERIHTKVTKYE